jgi:hypothetical protein
LSETLLLTLFDPPVTNTIPSCTLEVPWAELPAFFSEGTIPGEKGSAGYVIAATVADARKGDDSTATALVVDYEPPPGTRAQWDAFPCEFVAHSTASHSDAQERWRVFLRLTAPIPGELYRSVRHAIAPTMPPGAVVRHQTQPAYMPTQRPETSHRWQHGPLDWTALTFEKSRPITQITDRKVDPESVPSDDDLAALAQSVAAVWPQNNRHDASFALGGVLRNGAWPNEVCMAFAEMVLDTTGSDLEDGLECVQSSLAGGNGGVFGIPTLKGLLSSELPESDDPEDSPEAIVGGIVDALVAAIQADSGPPPALMSPKPLAVADSAAVRAAGFDPDTAFANWQIRLKTKPRGGLVLCAHNVRESLRMHPSWMGVFGYDELAQAVVILRKPPTDGLPKMGERWTADDYLPVQCWFGHTLEIEPSITLLVDSVKLVARENTFHPVRKYLEGLPAWDGVDRNLSTYLGAEQTEYNRVVCSTQLRAAVARVVQLGTGPNVDGPGCKADDMVILEGAQGIRKSTAIRALCPDPNWFYESRHDMSDKDFAQDMLGKWLCEIPEVDKIVASKDDSELKAMLSKTVDRYRRSYGRDSHDHPRSVVFFGTTNRSDYLRDETGNRRYQPLACGTIDVPGIIRDRDQLWAQAYHQRQCGQQWWLPEDLVPAAREAQAARLETDVWAGLVEQWVNSRDEGDQPFTTLEALAGLPGATAGADLNQGHKNRMGRTLRAMGYELKSLRRDEWKGWMWSKKTPQV